MVKWEERSIPGQPHKLLSQSNTAVLEKRGTDIGINKAIGEISNMASYLSSSGKQKVLKTIAVS